MNFLNKRIFFIIIILFFSIIIFYGCTWDRNEEIIVIQKDWAASYGPLKVEGNKLLDKDGNVVVLRGLSLYWSQWGYAFYNKEAIKYAKEYYGANVIRAAIGVELGGYLNDPEFNKSLADSVIQACIDLGIYVIVDWHDHNAPDHIDEAKEFFTYIAEKYKEYPNILYEIYNEPDDEDWVTIKAYAEEMIKTIRSIDPNNIIIVGTPSWNQNINEAADDPIDGYSNIMYAFHFYAATHKFDSQIQRNLWYASLRIPVFVTEWGTTEATGDGTIDLDESEKWLRFLEEKQISWCNWSYSNVNETSALLLPGEVWGGKLSESGSFVVSKLLEYNGSN